MDSVEPSVGDVEVAVEGQDRRGQLCPRVVDGGEAGDLVTAHDGCLGDVEAAHHDRAVGAENQVGRLRVVEHVGLGCRRRVAGHEGVAAHQNDAREMAGKIGAQEQGEGDVGEGADGYESDLTR